MTGAEQTTASKAVVRRLWDEVFNMGKLETAEELLAADCVDHNPYGDAAGAAETVKHWFAPLRAALPDAADAFPDLHSTFDAIIAEGDRVVVRGSERGTHHHAYRGAPPTGRYYRLDVLNIFRVADGRIVERWGAADTLGFAKRVLLGEE